MQKTFNGKTIIASIAAVFVLTFSLLSCERPVTINLGSSPPTLVVQGQIENGQPPFVVLSTTVGFFSTIDLATLQNTFVHGATVTVSDGTKTMTLKEYSLDTIGTSKVYYYTVDTANLSNLFVGQVEHYYTLTVISNGKTYTSVTKIPNPAPLDSIYVDSPLFTNSKTPPHALQLYGDYKDPDTIGNYVKYFTSRNNGSYYPADGVYNDQVINGTFVRKIQFEVGFNDSANANSDSLRYLYSGDKVTIKWCSIDKGVYTFWNTYQFAQNSVGNPFATPINVTSNISNGALGVWAGYGTYFKTLTIK